jgi:hypothetical protein
MGVSIQKQGMRGRSHKWGVVGVETEIENGGKSYMCIETAIALFHIKISPIISYAIDNIWEHLSKMTWP